MKKKLLLLLSVVFFGMGVKSQFGNALNFQMFSDNSSINKVIIPNSGFNFKNSTVELWVRPDYKMILEQNLPKPNLCTILGKEQIINGTSNVYPFGFHSYGVDPTNVSLLYHFYLSAGSNIVIHALSNYEMGKWYHLAATFSDTEVCFYINGVLQGKVSAVYDSYINDSRPLYMNVNQFINDGSYLTSAIINLFGGDVDELRIWNYPRTQHEIIENKDHQLTGNETGLYSYYDFNQGVSGQDNTGITTLIDKGSAGNNGILNLFILNSTTSNWVTNFSNISINTLPAIINSSKSFKANWTTPSGGLIPDKYLLDVAIDSSFHDFVPIEGAFYYKNYDVGNNTFFTLSGLAPSTDYYYRVRANKGGINSSYSNITHIKTPALLPQTINFELTPKKYGDIFTLNATSTSGLPVTFTSSTGNVEISGNTAHVVRGGYSTVGPCSISANVSGNDFYDGTSKSQILQIDKADLIYTAHSKSSKYGHVLASLTYDCTGFVNGDTYSSLFVAPSITTSISNTTPIGTYSGAISFTNGIDNFYNFIYQNGDYTVLLNDTAHNADQSISFPPIPTKVYGDVDFSPVVYSNSGLTVTLTSSDNSIASIVNGKIHINGVGVCTIYANQAGFAPYYKSAIQTSQTFTVSSNNSLKFDGIDDYVNCGNLLNTMTPSYTKEAWVKLSPSAGLFNNIVSGTSAHAFYIANGKLAAGHNGSWTDVQDTTNFPINVWTHVAVTNEFTLEVINMNMVQKNTMKLYRNGVLVGVNTNVSSLFTDPSVLIGSFNNSAFFKGEIDEVRVWTRALSANELNINMNTSLTGSETGLVGYYTFDQGIPSGNNISKTSLINLANQNNNALIKNMALNGIVSNYVIHGNTATQTITFNAIPNKSVSSSDFDPGASVNSYLPIIYTSSDANIATILNGKVHIVGVGTCTIYANQPGNEDWNAATEKSQTLTVLNGSQIITFNPLADKNFGSADFDPGASVDSNLPITYTVNDTTVATIINGKIHIVGVGTCTIYANQTGNSDWNAAAQKTQTFNVLKGNQIINFNSISTKTLDDADFVLSAVSSSGLLISYSSDNTNIATVLNGKIHIVGKGTCTIYANQTGNMNWYAATQTSQTLTVTDPVNNALNFDGTDDYVLCGNILTSSYTKEAWIKPTSSTGYLNIISGSANHAFWLVNGQLCSGHNGNWFYVVDAATVPLNTWTHVAITYDAATTTMKLYKNGVLVIANNAVPAITADNSLIIGTYGNNIGDFNGDMDEVKIWNKALTDAEIAADKSTRLAGTESGLVAYYDFNSGSAAANNAGITTLLDKSTYANNGVLNNFALSGASSNWVNSSVVVLKNQAAPSVSVNDINFLTESVGNLATSMEFSINGGLTWMNVTSNIVSVAPFLSSIPVLVQIRYKANATSYASPSTTIILPARPQNSPLVSVTDIDYSMNRIPVSQTMQYSNDGGINWHTVSAPSSISGLYKKAPLAEAYIDLTPYLSNGENLLIRYQPTISDFGSSYVTVVIPKAPAAPTNPVENTTANTFGFSLNPLYPDLSAYEFSVDYGATYQTVTSNPIAIGSQMLAVGDLFVRIKSVPSVSFAGLPLQNAIAYNNVTTAVKKTETSNIVIYPNPANDFITIKNVTANSRIAIYDLNGRMLLNEQVTEKPIDIHWLVKGVYVVKVVSDNKQLVGKLVKE